MKKYTTVMFMLLSLSASAGKWTIYKIEDQYSPKNDITSVCIDKQGFMWVGTSFGIYRYTNGNWVAQGTENIYVRTLFIDNQNTKWAGLTAGGVLRCDDGVNWEKVPEASKSHSVNVIQCDNKGSIWAGDWNEGLFNLVVPSIGKEQWVNYRAADEKTGDREKIGDNAILSITPDSKNRMWFGTYHGLSLMENNQWLFYDMHNSSLPDNNIYALAAGKDEIVWVGTGNGLVKIEGSAWTIYSNENSGLSCDLILSLATGHKGDIWVGTNKGLFYFNGEHWTHFTTENSMLPDNRIQSIVVHEHKIYIGTGNGLAVYEP
jgi:ligand-binding sensor domain-containing protein